MQPSMTIAPSPTNARSCNVQPCSMAMWPTSTSSPMTVGKPPAPSLSLSQWMMVPSWILEIGRAHVRTPVTNAHLLCRLLLEKEKTDCIERNLAVLDLHQLRHKLQSTTQYTCCKHNKSHCIDSVTNDQSV